MALGREHGGAVKRDEHGAGSADGVGEIWASGEGLDAPGNDCGGEEREGERGCVDQGMNPHWEEAALIAASKPTDAEHDNGPEEPASDGESAPACGEARGLLAVDVGESGEDQRVGHDDPDGQSETEVEVGDGHLTCVEQAEQDEADSGDELCRGVEEECGTGDEQRNEDGEGAEGRGAEHTGDEREDDERNGGFEGKASGGERAIGVEQLISAPIEHVVECGGEPEEAEGVDGCAGENEPVWQFTNGGGSRLVWGGRSPKDDKPSGGHAGEGGGEAREVEGWRKADEQASHWQMVPRESVEPGMFERGDI